MKTGKENYKIMTTSYNNRINKVNEFMKKEQVLQR